MYTNPISELSASAIERVEQLAHEAVREVFQSMLSMQLNQEEPTPLPIEPAGQIIGSVGFIGQTSGVIYLYAGMNFATIVTSRMLGLEIHEVDSEDMVNDAIGELSNIVAGYVKSRLCDDGWACTLTIPSVVRGQELRVEGSGPVVKRMLGFRNLNHRLLVELRLKEGQP